MADRPHEPDAQDLPEAVAVPKRRFTPQLIWLIPIVAVLVGGWLAVKAVLEHGPTITITFKTAEGLEAGKTKIKYKDVEIGVVKTVALTTNRKGIVATAELSKQAEEFLREDTRFFVVRPRITAGGVSGLGTLLSGGYIGMGRPLAREVYGAANVSRGPGWPDPLLVPYYAASRQLAPSRRLGRACRSQEGEG